MYLFWHAFFAFLLSLLAYKLLKPNPAWSFLFTATFFGAVPDLDHLLCWSPSFFAKLIPRYLFEGLSFVLRTEVYPCYLHLWVWPLALVATSVLATRHKYQKYIVAATVGWSLHLALDGIAVLL